MSSSAPQRETDPAAEEARIRQRLETKRMERRRSAGSGSSGGPPRRDRPLDRHGPPPHRPHRDAYRGGSRDRGYGSYRSHNDHHYRPRDDLASRTDRYGRSSRSRSPDRNARSHHYSHRPSRDRDDDYYYSSRSRYGSSNHAYSRHRRDESSSSSDDESFSSSSSHNTNHHPHRSEEETHHDDNTSATENALTKGKRTVLVSQLVMKATERKIHKYFHKQGYKVNHVSLLRDKRGTCKGIAYVELRNLQDVPKVVKALHNQVPSFQKFPILVKESEAERNFTADVPVNQAPGSSLSSANNNNNQVVTAAQMGMKHIDMGAYGLHEEAQKVYVGNLETSVTPQQLFCLFLPFGNLQRVTLQTDATDNTSKGFAFLTFRDPKEANLAIQSMAGQNLAGKPIKTGWASQTSMTPSVRMVTSDEFPTDNAVLRTQKAYEVLAQMTRGVSLDSILEKLKEDHTANTTTSSSNNHAALDENKLPPVGKESTNGSPSARLPTPLSSTTTTIIPPPPSQNSTEPTNISGNQDMMTSNNKGGTAAVPPEQYDDPSQIGNADKVSCHLLVCNMFDKNSETEKGWEEDVRLEFVEECSKFGSLRRVQVMHQEEGGRIYASFDKEEGAESCARTLAGRFFDGRRLRVSYVSESELPYRVT